MNIFIGYRRDDGGHARALYEKLLDWYDADQVFLDHEGINPGEIFTDALENAIAGCTVFLVVIGQHWLSDKNHKRLQEENDITRGEIRSALKHGKTIIPVLAGGAGFPGKSKLPEDIQAMQQANAHHQLDAQYHASFNKLRDKLGSCYGLKPSYRRRDGSPIPFRVIDLPLSPNFVDPANHLPELRRMLEDQGMAAVVAAATIHGMGGVGKTQMALKYSNEFRAQYAGVWWFRAENTSLLEIDCKDFLIAQSIAAPEGEQPHQTLKRWLQTQPRWLLVYDNAENKHDLAGFLPTAGGHHLIVTSRDPDWSDVALSLTLDVWTEEQALDFLRCRLKNVDDQERRQLTRILGGLPLALEQACAYILKHRVSVAVYCREVENWQRENPLLDRKDAVGYPYSVLTTLSLAFGKLGAPARQLLRLCAWFTAEPIPERIFREQADLLPESLQTVVADDLDWAETVAQLESHALVQRATIAALGNGDAGEEAALTLHRLTQAVVRAKLVEAKNDLGRAMLLLRDAFPGNVQLPKNWPACAALLPHVQGLERFSAQEEFDSEAYIVLLNSVATYLRLGQCLYLDARSLYEQALELAQKVYGEENEYTLAIMNNLASILSSLGDQSAASALQVKALEHLQQILGHEHPDTLTSMSNLALILWAQGDLKAARVLEEKGLQLRRRILGDEHLDTLTSMNNLAGTLRALGDLGDARNLEEKTLKLRLHVLGEEHPDTMTTMCNLALTLKAQRDWPSAYAMQERALELRRRFLGDEHLDTLTSMGNLAEIVREQGDLVRARALEEKVVESRCRVLGEAHPDTLTGLNNLALTLWLQGEKSDAQILFEKALESCCNALGKQHPDTTLAAFNLFFILLKSGAEERAKEIFRDHLEWLLQCEPSDLPSADQRKIREELLQFIPWLT